jgi:hypothetical protein
MEEVIHDLEYRLAAAERQREYCEKEMWMFYDASRQQRELMTQHDQTIAGLKAALEKLKA